MSRLVPLESRLGQQLLLGCESRHRRDYFWKGIHTRDGKRYRGYIVASRRT